MENKKVVSINREVSPAMASPSPKLCEGRSRPRQYQVLRKIIGLILLNIFISANLFAQTTPVKKEPITAKDSVIKQEKFDKVLWSKWSTVETDWNTKVFGLSLKNNGVKMSCAHCENVYMIVQLKVNAQGKLSASKVVEENKCGGKFTPKMKTEWLNYFGGKYEFPPAFRGKVIQVKLGTGLSC